MGSAGDAARYTTSRLAAASGYSGQQVRDLERLGVIPPATRQANGYRQFGSIHLIALRAYRQLAVAVGPVASRTTMREVLHISPDEAVARIVDLHVDLAFARDAAAHALRALDSIFDESAHDAPAAPLDAMSITELSAAVGVRASTLRFWESQGLLTPHRGDHGVRRYPPDAVRDVRIVAALRAGGHSIPSVRTALLSVSELGDTAAARDALRHRLHTLAARSSALLRAGNDLANLVSPPAAHDTTAGTP